MAGEATAALQQLAYENAIYSMNNAIGAANDMASLLSNTAWTTSVGIAPPMTVYNHIGYAIPPAPPELPDYGVAVPNKPTISAFTRPDIGSIPELMIAEPIIRIPDAPSMDLPASPGAPPEFITPAVPDKPTYTLPDAPVFTPVALPETPLIELPVFDLVADFGDITEPTERFTWNEAEYQSALLDATKDKLLGDIQNGGYGIDDTDERRLWDRARERELQAAETRIEEVTRLAAARGLTLPPGALAAEIEAAESEALAKSISLSRDIMIKKADMYVQARQFAITSSIQFEDMMLRYWGFKAERALNAAKLQVEMGVAVFNAQAARYNAKVQAYQSYASAFESRVRAALAGVEIFKAQIEGAKLTVDVQKLYADVYQTQINGVTSLMGLYKTEMDAAQIKAQIEQLKLSAFKAQVEAYAEQVRAQAAKFDMFEAQVKGEVAKVQVYDSSVRAYASRLQAVESKARVAETTARTEIAQATADIEIYKADLERYRAEVGVVSERIKALLQRYDGTLRQHAVATDAMKAYGENDIRAQEANARNYVAYSQIVAERLRAMIDQVIKDMDVRASAYNTAAGVHQSMGSAWASAVNGITATLETA